MVPPYQLVEVPVVPPYHLSKILKLCQTSFYELKVIVLMKEKLIPVSLKPKLNLIKIHQKLMGSVVPPYQLVGVPVVPPYHLTKIFKLCKTSFYEFKVIVLMKEKMFPVSLKPNLNLIKIRQKLVVSCGPPLPTGRGAGGPPLPLDQNFETLSNIFL